MNIVFNPHKKLHKDLYKQIDMLSELINSKKYEYKKELENYQLLNMKVNVDADHNLSDLMDKDPLTYAKFVGTDTGIYDPNIKTLKQTINDFQYFIDTLTELKIKIPVK